ncbi:MAG: reverse transcriptase family protein, partial [Oligoflexia bacterium]|nr:reverse transcriptase family protein [Oligoflexia bacterium]
MKPIFLELLNKIYTSRKVPEQMKIARILPLLKKGDKHNIENYRPISNICSLAKVFEKMILNRLKDFEENFKIDLTGTSQHGFKSKHSTITAGLELQSKIANKLDKGEYVVVSSFDLSAAFDVVNRNLLVKRMKVAGFPLDMIELLKDWLGDRHFYVEIAGKRSALKKEKHGTIQGSVLGPILYSIFVKPIYDLLNLLSYADDNYLVESGRDLDSTLGKVKMKAEFLLKWYRDSGLKVNETKTEVCIFSHVDTEPKNITLQGKLITTNKSIKVLGVLFDSKLTWIPHINSAISGARKKLQAIKLLSKYLSREKLIQVSTAFFYQKLYYGCQIWLGKHLNQSIKQKLLAASSQCLRICCKDYQKRYSYDMLHRLCNRATPNMWSDYATITLIHQILAEKRPLFLYETLCQKTVWHDRSNTIYVRPDNARRVGTNCISNRVMNLMKMIDKKDYELSNERFKKLAKRK